MCSQYAHFVKLSLIWRTITRAVFKTSPDPLLTRAKYCLKCNAAAMWKRGIQESHKWDKIRLNWMESDRAEQVRPQNCFSSKLLAAIKDFSAGLQIVVDDWQFSGRLPHFLPLLVESCQTTFEVNWPLGQLEQLEILSEQGEVLNMLNLRDYVSLNFRKQDIFQLVHRHTFWRDFLFYLFKCGPMPWFWRILFQGWYFARLSLCSNNVVLLLLLGNVT